MRCLTFFPSWLIALPCLTHANALQAVESIPAGNQASDPLLPALLGGGLIALGLIFRIKIKKDTDKE